jgi:GAF domain-containing protein
MGGAIAQECLVQPVLIREKPVAFLYAEFPPQRGATPLDLAYLRELAAATAAALAASIRLKKKPVI